MVKLALIGSDLSYSKSEKIHTFISNLFEKKISYDYFSIAKWQLKDTVKDLLNNYDGFNVTIPYKKSVIEHLDGCLGDAKAIQSVNTVLCDTKLGYNTDGDGFMLMLESQNVDVFNKRVLVLGAGGAATSCVYKLINACAKVAVYNRTYKNTLKLFDTIGGFVPLEKPLGKFDVIVNTTSVGMTNLTGQLPIDISFIKGANTLIDLIYNPLLTKFLEAGKSLGKKIVNGEGMLFFQAYYSQTLYFSLTEDKAQAVHFFNKFKAQGGIS